MSHTSDPRSRQAGFTLLEMMMTVAIMAVFMGGVLYFLISQTKISEGMFDRTDIQRGGRAALAIMEEKINRAGMGLPGTLAILSFGSDTCNGKITHRLQVASLDFSRQWKVTSIDADSGATTIALSSSDDPLDLSPTPGGTELDKKIPAGTWVFLHQSSKTSGGYALAQLASEREEGDPISIDNTHVSDDIDDFDLANENLVSSLSGNQTKLLIAELSTFGVNCDDPDHPYLYWRDGALPDDSTPTPIATNVDTREDYGLRFRFLIDGDDDGMYDDKDGDGVVSDGDFDELDRTDDDPIFSLDPDTATADNVVGIEVYVRLRSEEEDQMRGDYRVLEFSRVVRTPNIHSNYIFVGNTGI